ncbi:S-adenosyl-L-methionine-dependent methyltransferase [Podospora australis]|uniref:S-adenosyl-L-methionine-dependent methyltransferase n=1 Tax=Podospora australis TaxID=1536484 RepID=A0AAN6X4B4_9PEZI|nr:S-adenosyl-L-methionine-dependent methyltransferase [Podospora australis]
MSTTVENNTEPTTELSKQYDTPLGLAHTTMQALKDRIKQHYDLASDYYLSLWGEHIHHGYWPNDHSKTTESKETAQINLINLLLEISSLSSSAQPLKVLDVGCGLGGTSRFLASQLGASVTGITISSKQVQIATRLSREASSSPPPEGEKPNDFIPIGEKGGQVRFIELDAEKMGEFFAEDKDKFDVVWISEALSHFPDKALFFGNAFAVLKGEGKGKLVLADWFKDEGLSEESFNADIKPIEDGMLLPPMCTQQDYVDLAKQAGLDVLGGPKDISQDVSKTWDISWSLVQSPSLWAFAFSQGRDGIAFLQAFRAMRRGYANGSFRYAVVAFVKP